jgi:hydrogenase maturation protease
VTETVPERTRPSSTRLSSAKGRASVVVIGVGNSLRHDDAAGLETVRRLRTRVHAAEIAVREQEGETLGLLDTWEGVEAAVLVDAIHSGAAPGTIHRVDASSEPIPARLRGSTSTHAIGVGEAIELARALHRLPKRVIVFGVEGRRFDAGSGLSEEVRAVIATLGDAVFCEARELAG